MCAIIVIILVKFKTNLEIIKLTKYFIQTYVS